MGEQRTCCNLLINNYFLSIKVFAHAFNYLGFNIEHKVH